MKKENLEKVEVAFDTLLDFVNESVERRKMAKEGLIEANEMSEYKGLIEKVYKEKEKFINKQKSELKKVGKKIKKAYNKKKEFIKQQQNELKDIEVQIRKIFIEKKGFIKKQEEELEKIGKKLGIKQEEQNLKKANIDVDIENKINNNISLL